MKKIKIVAWIGIVIILNIIFAEKASAIPTFARKYRTSCTTCHIGFNKVNAFGEAFRLNGYNVPEGDAAYVKEEPVSLGAPAWKKVWPEAVWPGVIPGTVPISFMAHQRLKVEQDDSRASQASAYDFNFPHEFELLLGGTFGDFASFYGEYVLDEDGEVEGLERLFIQFNDLFYGNFGNFLPENALNLKIGRFHIAAEPFHDPTRRTLTHLRMNDYTVGSSTWNFRDLQSGIEVDGILLSRLRYAAGVVNGSGTVTDNNQRKDIYGRLSYKYGGMAFDGTGAEELGEELKQTNNWVDNSVTLGTFGYFGTSNVSTWKNNQFFRIGGDLRVSYANLDLYGALVYGQDSKAFTDAELRDIDSYAWFIGGDYVVFPWLTASLRYEDENIFGGQKDIQKFVSSLAIFPRANIRCVAEFIYYPEPGGDEDGNHLLLVDLAYLF